MTEEACRKAIHARSGGLCEVDPTHPADEASHRLSRAHSPSRWLWSPTNLLHLCRAHHAALHADPAAAYAGGWHLRAGQSPPLSPVWLAVPWPGWWLIVDPPDGPHLLVPVAADGVGLPDRPTLPALARRVGVDTTP